MRFCCSVKPSQLWWDCSPIRTINEIFRTIPLAFRRARGLPLPLHRTSPPSQPLQKNDNPSPRTKLASLVKGRWLDGKAQALTLCIYLRYAHHFYIANFSAAKTEGLSRRHLFTPAPKIAPHSMSGRKCGGVVEMCLLCWFRIVRNLGQALSCILAFAVVWVAASLQRLCATAIVHPCTFMNALWALHPCKASGRSFYKASVPYPHSASSPPSTKKSRAMPVCDSGSVAGCRIVLALLVSHRAKLGASTIVHPCTTRKMRVLPPTNT